MLKEILIAGLLGSVASVDTHQTMHYQNNTKYHDLRCGLCDYMELPETHITYLQDSKNKYNFMDLFLVDYSTEVVEPFIKEFYSYYNSDDKEFKYISSLNFKQKFDDLSSSLIKKVKHDHSVNMNNSDKRLESVSFRITHDGVLTFGKMN